MLDLNSYEQLKKETFDLLAKRPIKTIQQLRHLSSKVILIAQNEKKPEILEHLNRLISLAQEFNDTDTQMNLLFEKFHQFWFVDSRREETYQLLDTLLSYYKVHSDIIYHILLMEHAVVEHYFKKLNVKDFRDSIHALYKRLKRHRKRRAQKEEIYYLMYGKLLHALHYYSYYDKKAAKKALKELFDCYDYFLKQPFKMRILASIIRRILVCYGNLDDLKSFRDFYLSLEDSDVLDNLTPNYKGWLLSTISFVEFSFSNVSTAEKYIRQAYDVFPRPPHSDLTDAGFYCSLLYHYVRINIASGKFNESYRMLLQLNDYMRKNQNSNVARYFMSQQSIEKTISSLFFFIVQEMHVDMYKMQGTVLEDMVNRFIDLLSSYISDDNMEIKISHEAIPETEDSIFGTMTLTLLHNILRQMEKNVKIRNEEQMIFVLKQIKQKVLSLPLGKSLAQNEELLIDIYEAKVLLFNDKFEQFKKHVKNRILKKKAKTVFILDIWKQALSAVCAYLETNDIHKFNSTIKKIQHQCLKNNYRETNDELQFVVQFLAMKRFYEEHKKEIREQAMKDAYIALSEKMGRELIETLSKKQTQKDRPSKE